MFAPNCMSPELVQNLALTEKSDIWSVGMILIEIITLEIPYNECSLNEDIINNVNIFYQYSD